MFKQDCSILRLIVEADVICFCWYTIYSLRALLNQEEEMEELFDDEGVDEEFEIEGKGKTQDCPGSQLESGRKQKRLVWKVDCQGTKTR